MTFTRARLPRGAAALCAALGGYWLAQQLDGAGPRLASGTWLPQPKAVRDFRLTDTTGRAFTRAELAGGPTLVFFGFTHCPDGCPTPLMTLAQVTQRAAPKGLRALFSSSDPHPARPPVLRPYLPPLHPRFL